MLQIAQQAGRRAVRSVPLAQAYAGRANSFGFLRLCFAFGVVLAHAAVLGYLRPLHPTIDVPGLAVAGFFGISGFLITRSAKRTSLFRYLWHRALRIWPGLWVCLLFIGFVLAPWMFYLAHGNLDGLWRSRLGVLNYLQANWWGGLRQQPIVDVFRDTPYGTQIRRSVVNGSLWTLSYEITCYLIVAVLAVVGVLKRARWLVLLATVAVFGLLCWNHYAQLRFGHPPVPVTGKLPWGIPVFGLPDKIWFLIYGFMFLAGAAAELYSDRLPINDVLGVVALVVIGWFAYHRQLFGPGLLAYEYLILYLAVRLPRVLHRVGQRNDYSYGVYIYSFPLQQTLAHFRVYTLGYLVFALCSGAVSFALAFVSWHLVEKQALKLKDWRPRWTGRGAGKPAQDVAVPEQAPSSGAEATPAPVPARTAG